MWPCKKETLSNLVLIHCPRIPLISREIRQRYELCKASEMLLKLLYYILDLCKFGEKT